MIVVPANSPHQDPEGLMAAFKANPGSISWGGGSAGGTDHILAGLIAKDAGVDASKVNYVAFKGGGEAVAAIIGGHVTVGISGVRRIRRSTSRPARSAPSALSSPNKQAGICRR